MSALTTDEPAPRTDVALGEMLRSAREVQGLGQAELARQLNLDVRLIEALEREQLDALPAPVYVRGYLRRLAMNLGLDEQALLAAHERLAGAPEPAALRATPPIETMRTTVEGGRRWPWVVFGLVLAVLVLGFYGARHLPERWLETLGKQEPGLSEPLPPPATTLPLPPPTSVPPEPPLPPSPQAVQEPAPAPAPAVGEVVPSPMPAPIPEPVASPGLELRASKGESWIQVKDAAGKVLFEGVLKAGGTRQVDGARPFQVVISRAEAISLTLDGKTVDLAPHVRPNGKAFIANLGG